MQTRCPHCPHLVSDEVPCAGQVGSVAAVEHDVHVILCDDFGSGGAAAASGGSQAGTAVKYSMVPRGQRAPGESARNWAERPFWPSLQIWLSETTRLRTDDSTSASVDAPVRMMRMIYAWAL